MTTTPTSSPTLRLRVGALAVGGAVLATALLWTAAQLLGIELRVDPRNGRPPGVISLPFAATLTFAVSAAGWGVRALLDRMVRRASRVWTVLAILVLLVSFLPLFAIEATGATKTILALMHAAVAAVLIPTIGRQNP
jgi:hypothetical protein